MMIINTSKDSSDSSSFPPNSESASTRLLPHHHSTTKHSTHSRTAAERTVTSNMPNRNTRSFLSKLATILEVLVRLVIMIFSHFWKMCTTGLLIVVLLFWTEGCFYASVFFFFGIIGLFYNAQDMFLYNPEVPADSRMMVLSPSTFQMPFENHSIKCCDGTLINAFLIKQQTNPGGSGTDLAPTIVYFHGNAGNIGHRLQNALGLYSTLNANILMVEYRGFGKSQGSPSESGIYQDAEAAIDFLLKRSDIDKSQIVVFGRSLGGAVAIHLASSATYGPKLAALVVENTFSSIYDMACRVLRLGFLRSLPHWCFKNKYPSSERMSSVSVPCLFLSGLLDELVPPLMMKELYNKSKSSMKRLETFASGTHNDTWMSPGYYEAWIRFIPEALRRRREVTMEAVPSSSKDYVLSI